MSTEYSSDILIIGSGVAGLSLALKAAKFARVTVVTKKQRVESATNRAQGGIAAVLSKEDCFVDHIRDTLVSGDGLCHEDVVKLVVEEGPERVRELVALGARFQMQDNGTDFELGREGGHSARRVAHADTRTGSADVTGREIERTLLEQVAANPDITVLENHLAVDLLLASRAGAAEQANDRCLGAYVLNDETGEVEIHRAEVTVLCTGGCGKVYLYTTNPDISTGDGVVMAYRAGAKVANLEFIQFHPTCFYNPEITGFLISEAVRGEGAILRNRDGEAFMKRYDPRGDLATRDAVARGIDAEMKKSGTSCVYLDISHKPATFVRERFPNIHATCLRGGVDITKEPIPVVPAAHYMCGGVLVDQHGQSSLTGLMALGEASCTGLHGANRLASNSLLEAVVYAHRAAEKLPGILADLRKLPKCSKVQPWKTGGASPLDEGVLISRNWDDVRRQMWDYVGIVRSTKRLNLMRDRLDALFREISAHFYDYLLTPDLVELRNLVIMAELIVNSAMHRQESRGLHYILDYPQKDDRFLRDTVLDRATIDLIYSRKQVRIIPT